MKFQFFGKDTIETKFIKDLLKDTYIPTVPIWKQGKPIIKGFIYITRTYIVKAKRDESKMPIDVTINNAEYFEIIEPYIWGKFYPSITTNYISNTSFYDSRTHAYLGEYLRVVRDLFGIDLLPYYNCWGNSFSDTLRIENNKVVQKQTSNDGLKCLLVPIKPFQEYTIYLDTNFPVQVAPIYFDGVSLLYQSNDLTNYIETLKKCSHGSPTLFKSPSIQMESSVETPLEKYLILLIQLPASDVNNVVILEGNYLENKFINNNSTSNGLPLNHINYSEQEIDSKSEAELNLESICSSVYSLSRYIGTKVVAFSNRLIEYLLLNVITKNDQITQDIQRVQEYSSSTKNSEIYNKRYTKNYTKGIWGNSLRYFLFTEVSTIGTPLRVDINGYIDKDTEEIILGGKE